MVNNQNREGRNDGKTVLEQTSDVTIWILSITVGLSILKMFFSSLFLYGVMKNKAIIIQAYIIYRYLLIVASIIIQIYGLISLDSHDELVALAYLLYGGQLVVGVILFIYIIFLFIIQYNVVRHGGLSGSQTNPVNID